MRFYTYSTTLGYALEEAGARGIEVVVLDRPNPLGGELVDGPAADPDRLLSVLAKYGCHGIEAVGTDFDPNVHEAVSHVPSEQHAAGKVIQEVAPGYRLHERVVRPSNVIVSSGPTHEEEKQEEK